MTKTPHDTEVHRLFRRLYTSPKRYFLLTGGRASLKSTTVHAFIARLTCEAGHGVLFTRYTMASAEASIIPEFKIVAERIGMASLFDFTRNRAVNRHTGSFIHFSGIKTSEGSQTAKLKSLAGITTLVVEEGEDFGDEKAFDGIDDSIRASHVQNRVIWIQNPTTKEHFIYRRFILGSSRVVSRHGYNITMSAHPDVEHIHSSYHIAEKYLDENWLHKAEAYKAKAEAAHALYEATGGQSGAEKHRSWYYTNYIGGWLEKAEGVIFEQWEEGEFDTSLPFAFGLDFGYFPDPSAMVKVAVDHKRKVIYLQEEFYRHRLSTEEIRAMVSQAAGPAGAVIADSADPRLIAEVRKSSPGARPAEKGPDSVRAGLLAMLGYKIIVAHGSENVKNELNNYAWNDRKSTTPIGSYNHAMDASRYAFMWLVGMSSRPTLPRML